MKCWPTLAVALWLSACSSDTCTEIGCSSAGVIRGDMPTPTGSVTVEACRNGACRSLTTNPDGCQSVPLLHVCFTPAAGTTRVDVTLYHDGSSAALMDGDQYTLVVREDASDTALVDFSGSATYSDHWPNGAGCPPVCKAAELSL